MEAQKDQKILLKLLYDYVAQLIRLYMYLLDDHKLKNVHIKPYNVLESANSLKIYDLQVSKTQTASRNDRPELFTLYKHMFLDKSKVQNSQEGVFANAGGSPARQPGRGDLFDLATFIYWMCTRQRLFEEEDDFDYFIMFKQVHNWLEKREENA